MLSCLSIARLRSRIGPLGDNLASLSSAPPNILERLRRHRGVTHCVGDAGVAKEVLQASSVHAPPSQSVAGAVSEHVDMHREWQLRSLARSLNHAPNAHATEWMASLIHEHIGRLDLRTMN